MRPHRPNSRRLVAVLFCGLIALAASPATVPAVRAVELPSRLTDQEFWGLTGRLSESNGSFRSDNFLSNERGYQVVIPELLKVARTNRVYLGVGPEQNFPYLIALKPQLAIIFDIRRGNLHEHLLYKALFEMSRDRADFLSRLWSRPRPAGLTEASTVEQLMTAFTAASSSADTYASNLAAVSAWLTKTPHRFALHDGDLDGIDYVYKSAFFDGGPGLNYSMVGGGGGGNRSTYAELQMLDDGQGLNRGFLATEANWLVMKDLESRNLIVPVVGDFGGPSAIRGVGAYLKAQGALVSAFYLSNVEQYLNQDAKEDTFLCNVAELPLDDTSTFIFTGSGRYGRGFGGRGGLNTTFLRPMLPDTSGCRATSPTAITGQ
ncbi:MAG: hypothetical protein ABI634_02915 [Acidobacteriota bacterium]